MSFFRGLGGGSGGRGGGVASGESYDETEGMTGGGGERGGYSDDPAGDDGGGEGGGGGRRGGVASLSISDADDILREQSSRTSRGIWARRLCAAAFAVLVAGAATAIALGRVPSGLSSLSPSSSSSGPPPEPPSHPSYTLQYSSVISEYDLTVAMYRHDKTDAELLAVLPNAYDGEDKTFGISFRTVPTDSTGVAHVLEHSVLCGSTKYPVKDPFLHLLKGSLQTFLNAMTYADRTVYPVASRNRRDFRNLADVYLDAVFHPRCVNEEWVLKQEGWRYELESGDEGDGDEGDLEVRGVVMSEMMGAYSDPDEVLYQTSQTLLFPDNTYRYDSGGEPTEIPDLSFDAFREFYAAHYHPTNSKTFVSGDVEDIAMVLDLADSYLSEYEFDPKVRSDSAVPYQTIKFSSPVRERRPYAGTEGEDGDGHTLSVQWLLNDGPLPKLTEMALAVLDDLLLGSSSSVLRKALLDSGLGEEVIDDGLDDELLQDVFTVGLKGIGNAEDVAKAEGVIMDTLGTLARDGFDPDDVEASMNSVEFALREFSTRSYPRSVVVFLEMLHKWNYDQDPRSSLSFEATLNQLKAEIEQNGSAIFRSLVETYLLSNNHRVVLEFYPSSTYESEQLAEEKKRLGSIKASLSPVQLKKIRVDAEALAELQSKDDSPEAVATVPTLALSDLDRNGVEHPISVRNDAFGSGATLVIHDVPSSSGVAYVDLGLDVSAVPFDNAPLLPLLARMMTRTGTSSLSEVELDRQIGMHTGGVSVSNLIVTVNPAGTDGSTVTAGTNLRTMLFVRGKCTKDKSSRLFPLVHDVLTDAKLDSKDKAVQILQEMSSELRTDIPSSGSHYARKRIEARYSPAGYLDEILGGVSQVDTIESLLDSALRDWPSVLKRLVSVRAAILSGTAVLNLTGDRAVLDAVQPDVQAFLKADVFSSGGGAADYREEDHPWIPDARAGMAANAPLRDEGMIVPTKVNYVGEGGVLYGEGETVSGSTAVVSRYLQNGYLWETVRVLNGAYGAGASFDRHAGTLVLSSYRDPEVGKTLEAFDAAADNLRSDASSALPEDDGAAVTKAVVAAIGHLDGSALRPDQVGWASLMQWMRGESAAERQRWRSEILGTSVQDFADFARRLDGWKSPSLAVVGSQGALDEYSSSAGAAELEIVLNI